jgi:hypothetical protein
LMPMKSANRGCRLASGFIQEVSRSLEQFLIGGLLGLDEVNPATDQAYSMNLLVQSTGRFHCGRVPAAAQRMSEEISRYCALRIKRGRSITTPS